MARDEGVLVSISSDAHSVLELNNLKYGIGQARPGWLRTERSGDAGHVYLLGQRFAVSPKWLHRLVRCEIDFDHHRIRCFALRRRAPGEQPLLTTIPYHSSKHSPG